MTEDQLSGSLQFHGVGDPPASPKLALQQKKKLCCQVDDCGLSLSNDKTYNQRHRVCQEHLKSLTVPVGGVDSRFCQQCARFHSVEEFDGTKRSCRSRLSQHNARRRRKPGPDDCADVDDGSGSSTPAASGPSKQAYTIINGNSGPLPMPLSEGGLMRRCSDPGSQASLNDTVHKHPPVTNGSGQYSTPGPTSVDTVGLQRQRPQRAAALVSKALISAEVASMSRQERDRGSLRDSLVALSGSSGSDVQEAAGLSPMSHAGGGSSTRARRSTAAPPRSRMRLDTVPGGGLPLAHAAEDGSSADRLPLLSMVPNLHAAMRGPSSAPAAALRLAMMGLGGSSGPAKVGSTGSTDTSLGFQYWVAQGTTPLPTLKQEPGHQGYGTGAFHPAHLGHVQPHHQGLHHLQHQQAHSAMSEPLMRLTPHFACGPGPSAASSVLGQGQSLGGVFGNGVQHPPPALAAGGGGHNRLASVAEIPDWSSLQQESLLVVGEGGDGDMDTDMDMDAMATLHDHTAAGAGLAGGFDMLGMPTSLRALSDIPSNMSLGGMGSLGALLSPPAAQLGAVGPAPLGPPQQQQHLTLHQHMHMQEQQSQPHQAGLMQSSLGGPQGGLPGAQPLPSWPTLYAGQGQLSATTLPPPAAAAGRESWGSTTGGTPAPFNGMPMGGVSMAPQEAAQARGPPQTPQQQQQEQPWQQQQQQQPQEQPWQQPQTLRALMQQAEAIDSLIDNMDIAAAVGWAPSSGSDLFSLGSLPSTDASLPAPDFALQGLHSPGRQQQGQQGQPGPGYPGALYPAAATAPPSAAAWQQQQRQRQRQQQQQQLAGSVCGILGPEGHHITTLQEALAAISWKIARCLPEHLPQDLYQRLHSLVTTADAATLQAILHQQPPQWG